MLSAAFFCASAKSLPACALLATRPIIPIGPSKDTANAVAPYSLRASLSVRDNPACARSSICWVTSVGTSAAIPVSVPLVIVASKPSSTALDPPVVNNLPAVGPRILATIFPPNGINVPRTSNPAIGTAVPAAAPRLISNGLP